MDGADGRERAIGAGQRQHRQIGASVVVQRHPHASHVSPETYERRLARGEPPRRRWSSLPSRGREARSCRLPHRNIAATCWNHVDQRGRQVNAGEQNQAEMRAMIGSADALEGPVAARRLAERHALQAQHEGAESDEQAERRAAARATGARAKVEVTTRNSLMNTPIGGRPAIANTPKTRLQPSQRLAYGEARDVGDPAACP